MTTDRSHLDRKPRPASGLYVGGGKTFVPPAWSGLSLMDDAVSRLPVIDDPDQPLDLDRRLRERDLVRESNGPNGWHGLVVPPPRLRGRLRVLAVCNVSPVFLTNVLGKASRLLADDGVAGLGLVAGGDEVYGPPPPGTLRRCLTTAEACGLVLFDCLPGPLYETRLFLRTVRNHDPLPRDCTLRLFEAVRANKPPRPEREDDETRASGSPTILVDPAARFGRPKRRAT